MESEYQSTKEVQSGTEWSTFQADTLELEDGEIVEGVQVCYKTYGELNKEKTNCVVVCHALTGNADVKSWWPSFFQPLETSTTKDDARNDKQTTKQALLDESELFIVCVNILGSPHNPTNPSLLSYEALETSFYMKLSIRDNVKLQMSLVFDYLNVPRVRFVMGGSLGGMLALEWGLLAANRVDALIVMACGSKMHPWQAGFSELQRRAIMSSRSSSEPLSKAEQQRAEAIGLKLARQIALMSYRSHQGYEKKFSEQGSLGPSTPEPCLRSTSKALGTYFDYQGERFVQRYDAKSYLAMTRIMDTHDIGRQRGGVVEALKQLKSSLLVLSISSDFLYPCSEQETLVADCLKSREGRCTDFGQVVSHCLIESDSGHDGFLLDQQTIRAYCVSFLKDVKMGQGQATLQHMQKLTRTQQVRREDKPARANQSPSYSSSL